MENILRVGLLIFLTSLAWSGSPGDPDGDSTSVTQDQSEVSQARPGHGRLRVLRGHLRLRSRLNHAGKKIGSGFTKAGKAIVKGGRAVGRGVQALPSAVGRLGKKAGELKDQAVAAVKAIPKKIKVLIGGERYVYDPNAPYGCKKVKDKEFDTFRAENTAGACFLKNLSRLKDFTRMTRAPSLGCDSPESSPYRSKTKASCKLNKLIKLLYNLDSSIVESDRKKSKALTYSSYTDFLENVDDRVFDPKTGDLKVMSDEDNEDFVLAKMETKQLDQDLAVMERNLEEARKELREFEKQLVKNSRKMSRTKKHDRAKLAKLEENKILIEQDQKVYQEKITRLEKELSEFPAFRQRVLDAKEKIRNASPLELLAFESNARIHRLMGSFDLDPSEKSHQEIVLNKLRRVDNLLPPGKSAEKLERIERNTEIAMSSMHMATAVMRLIGSIAPTPDARLGLPIAAGGIDTAVDNLAPLLSALHSFESCRRLAARRKFLAAEKPDSLLDHIERSKFKAPFIQLAQIARTAGNKKAAESFDEAVKAIAGPDKDNIFNAFLIGSAGIESLMAQPADLKKALAESALTGAFASTSPYDAGMPKWMQQQKLRDLARQRLLALGAAVKPRSDSSSPDEDQVLVMAGQEKEFEDLYDLQLKRKEQELKTILETTAKEGQKANCEDKKAIIDLSSNVCDQVMRWKEGKEKKRVEFTKANLDYQRIYLEGEIKKINTELKELKKQPWKRHHAIMLSFAVPKIPVPEGKAGDVKELAADKLNEVLRQKIRDRSVKAEDLIPALLKKREEFESQLKALKNRP